MITTDKVTEIFCILDEFCKNLDAELTKNLHIDPIDEGYKRMRNRKGQMSKSEIMTILLCYHFGSFRNFKHYYLFFIKEHLASYFPKAVSYTAFRGTHASRVLRPDGLHAHSRFWKVHGH